MPFDAQTEADAAQLAHAESPVEQEPDLTLVYAALAVVIAAWVASAITFGLPGFFLPPLFMVPVVVLILIRLAWG